MSKIVRIQSDMVVEIFAAEPVLTAALMATIRNDAPDDVAVGWTFNGSVFAAPVAPVPTTEDYLDAIGAMLNAKVAERFYDNIVSACSYADSTNAKFKAEALACIAWRDAVYGQCYTDLAAVQAGTMQQPSVEAFVASLPQLTWPS